MNYFKVKAGARPASRNHNAVGKEDQEGMALIDWFAGQIITGIVESSETPKRISEWAYDYAKSMMEERARLMEEENDI